jgi:hypothetical protein
MNCFSFSKQYAVRLVALFSWLHSLINPRLIGALMYVGCLRITKGLGKKNKKEVSGAVKQLTHCASEFKILVALNTCAVEAIEE